MKSINKSLITLFITLLVLFFLAEVNTRHAFFGTTSNTELDSITHIGCTELIQQNSNGWGLRPNTDVFFKMHDVSINSDGLRGEEIPDKTDRRILIIGDSSTFGEGIAQDDTISKNFERITDIETINGGQPGYNYRELIRAAIEYDELFNPDIILFVLLHNDLLDQDKEYSFECKVTPSRTLFFVEWVVKSFRSMGTITKYSITKSIWNDFDKHMAKLDLLSDKIVILTAHEMLPSDDPEFISEVRTVAEKYDIKMIDVSYSIEGKDPEDFTIYPLDRHPDAEAVLQFTEKAIEELRELNLPITI